MNLDIFLYVAITAAVLAVAAAGIFVLSKPRRGGNTIPRVGRQSSSLTPELHFGDIEKIEIQNGFGNKLELTKFTESRTGKYVEVSSRISALGSAGLNASLPLMSLAEIAKSAPNGLFTATAPIKDLMKYKDGTVSSIVSKNSRYSSHNGFREVNISKLNPSAVIGMSMQAMAAISGQYFMVEITSKLDDLKSGIDQLINLHHDEKLGQLRSVENVIKNISNKSKLSQTDINDLRASYRETDAISQEYALGINRFVEGGIDNVQDRKIFSKIWAAKDIEGLLKELDNQKFPFNLKVCLYAEALKQEILKAEYAAQLKIGDADAASDALSQLRYIKSESFIDRSPALVQSLFEQIDKRAQNLIDRQWVESDKANEKLDSIVKARQELQGFVSSFVASNTESEIDDTLSHPAEIIYVPDAESGESKIYVLEENFNQR